MTSQRPLAYITGNSEKFAVASAVLTSHRITLEQVILDLAEPQSLSVQEIALAGAAQATTLLQRPALRSDVGVFIQGLGGFPGPFIKYLSQWFSPQEFLKLTSPIADRHVVVREALVYADGTRVQQSFISEYRGSLAENPRGKGSLIEQFLIPDGSSRTLGELPDEERRTFFCSTADHWREFAEWLPPP